MVAAENTDVSGLAATEGGLSWTQLDRALPLPLSFEDGETELAQRAGADIESLDREPLVVTGLAAGRFELKIDGQSVGTFADAELAKGVNLARYRTPMRWQAYAVKWSVGGGHEAQRVRRELLVAAAKDPSLQARRRRARRPGRRPRRSSGPWTRRPKPRRYELVAGPLTYGALPFARASRSRALVHLAHGVAGQRVHAHERPRHLERREQAAAGGLERGRVGLAGEAGDGHLAPARVGHAEDRRLAHAGLLEQDVLDLAGVDVEARR